MKYGVILLKQDDNIGNIIQSYAASRFLPRIGYIVEQRYLHSFRPKNNEKVAVVFAGWHCIRAYNWPPSPYISTLVISLHLDQEPTRFVKDTKRFIFTKYVCAWLQNHSPIGCRGESTLNMLSDQGISAYLSGCITLKLDPLSNVEYHGNICAVDVSDAVLE